MLYQLLKDFAGPVATVIAAATAAVFIRRQAKTADRQARTALDQLRYNLFERRYADLPGRAGHDHAADQSGLPREL